MDIEIRHSNNIVRAHITLTADKLNIKFAPNGTGKVTWELILDGYSESSYSATSRFAAARLPWFTIIPAYAGPRRSYSCATCNHSVPLARHILVTISESLYTVYIRSNDEVINGTG